MNKQKKQLKNKKGNKRIKSDRKKQARDNTSKQETRKKVRK